MSSLVPRRLKQEVERYLGCGDVRCGFVEVRCASCHDARLVAFSCKGRGSQSSVVPRRVIVGIPQRVRTCIRIAMKR